MCCLPVVWCHWREWYNTMWRLKQKVDAACAEEEIELFVHLPCLVLCFQTGCWLYHCSASVQESNYYQIGFMTSQEGILHVLGKILWVPVQDLWDLGYLCWTKVVNWHNFISWNCNI
jgi:hypothetical protein